MLNGAWASTYLTTSSISFWVTFLNFDCFFYSIWINNFNYTIQKIIKKIPKIIGQIIWSENLVFPFLQEYEKNCKSSLVKSLSIILLIIALMCFPPIYVS